MTANDEDALRALYCDLGDASMRKDAAAIRTLLAPDYALVHMTGMHQSREDYIAAVTDCTLNYFSTEHDSIDVRISADGMHATICGRSHVEAAVFGCGRHVWRLQQELKAKKRDGRWLLTESRASTY